MAKYRIGYTQGVFDMFHVGHLNLLNHAAGQCDYLIAGVNSDRLVEEYKHKKPVIPEEERVQIVGAIKVVDRAEITDTLDKEQQYRKYHFDAVFIGDDWKGDPRWQETERVLSSYGVDVIYLPYTKGVCSTVLKEQREEQMQGTSDENDA